MAYGFYTTNSDVRLKLEKSKYIECQQGVIVFVPPTFYNFKNMDSIIGPCDIERGYITFDDIMRHYNISSNIFEVSQEDKDAMEILMNEFGDDNSECDTFIFEICICTIEFNCKPSFCKKLKLLMNI